MGLTVNTSSFHFYPWAEWLSFKKTNDSLLDYSSLEDVESWESFLTHFGNGKWCGHYGNKHEGF